MLHEPKPGLKKLKANASFAALATGALTVGWLALRLIKGQQFTDDPFELISSKSDQQFGRQVNGLSALIAPVVAQHISSNATFTANIDKPGWFDAGIKGQVSSTSINSEVSLTTSSAGLSAMKLPSAQYFSGTAFKSELNWGIEQTSPTTWEIKRFGLKSNYTLTLTYNPDGTVLGNLDIPYGRDWSIKGKVTGNTFHVKVQTPLTKILTPSFAIDGTVTAAHQ